VPVPVTRDATYDLADMLAERGDLDELRVPATVS